MPASDAFAELAAGGVRGLAPYVPGKPLAELEREFGIRDAIKLASNENPLGPPVASLNAMRGALQGVGLYPDGAAFDLKQALADHLSVSPEQITVGNGSNEVLSIIAETFLSPGLEAVYSQYAFLVYALCVQATGARARVAAANGPANGQPLGHDLDAMAAQVNARTRVVFIANPNNPTGTWLEARDLRGFIASLPEHVLVVLDEAYCEYAPDGDMSGGLGWVREFPRLIVTRTFSKIYGLAGLRIGYAVSHPAVAELLNRVRQPFNVNALAQVAARAALAEAAHIRQSRELNRAGLVVLRDGLQAIGWSVPLSAGNFVLADTGAPAHAWNQALLRAGIIVRPVANYGLPNHLRITTGLPEHNQRLLATVRKLASGGVAVS